MDFSQSANQKIKKKIELSLSFQSENILTEKLQPLVALSGGADSLLAFYYIVFLYQKGYSKKPLVFHLNHKLRKEADKEERFCRTLAESFECPYISVSINPEKRKNTNRFSLLRYLKHFKKKLILNPDVDIRKNESIFVLESKLLKLSTLSSLEEKARLLRYMHLDFINENLNAGIIITGQNLSDWWESSIMKLYRGAPFTNLFSHRKNVMYPLLFFFKDEIVSILKKNKISYNVDESNKDINYKRNKIRQCFESEAENSKSGLKDSLKLGMQWNSENEEDILRVLKIKSSEKNIAFTLNKLMAESSKEIYRKGWTNAKFSIYRIEVELDAFLSLSSFNQKIVLDRFSNSWGFPNLASGFFNQINKGLPNLINSKYYANGNIKISVGCKEAKPYLVLRPEECKQFIFPAEFSFCESRLKQIEMKRNRVPYSKKLVIKQGQISRKISHLFAEKSISILDRYYIPLIVEKNEVKAVLFSRIRSEWKDISAFKKD